jgi:Domain of unknown function (DUF4157)
MPKDRMQRLQKPENFDTRAFEFSSQPPERQGQALTPETRAQLEPGFGHSFADVRVFSDQESDRQAKGLEAQDSSNHNRALFGNQVQRKAFTSADFGIPQNAQAIAQGGVENAHSPLPHLETIQRSFGHHDISGVQTKIGGTAKDAANSLGAEAYTTRDRVGFSNYPDLHVAAHEAAHVVQQRSGGVNLESGIDQPGDIFERQADTVASSVVRGESAALHLDQMMTNSQAQTTQVVQRFGADEHEFMGNQGSGAAPVRLAEDYILPFGEVVALAGDHFSSIQQMRLFAANTSGGAGSRLEIEYARRWKLGKPVTWKENDPDYERAKLAQEKRYYVLAGGNEEHYKGNLSHFVNPQEGDMDRSTSDKARDQEIRSDDQTSVRTMEIPILNKHIDDPDTKKGQWIDLPAGVGAVGSYRLNHAHAITEAALAGANKQPLEDAMAQEAFACHYLTDSFASGHVRTPRISAKEYWDAKVPMFYENLVGFMAQEIARYLVAHETEDVYGWFDADTLGEEAVWGGAKDQVRDVFESKARITFGDFVALAIHDWDNGTGVAAHVEGKQEHLVGDGKILENGKLTAEGTQTATLVAKAVSLSVADIRKAYQLGSSGKDPSATISEIFGDDKMFSAERLVPMVTAEDRQDPSNPELQWKFDSFETLLADDRMIKALQVFLKNKASDLNEVNFTGDKKDALMQLGAKMQGDPKAVITEVINWTPDSGGGVGGHNQDDNARDYVDTARGIKGGLVSLTSVQRIKLAVDCINGYISESDEETVWELLETASESQARDVIKHIGWDDLTDYLDGVEDNKFRARFPEETYGDGKL